MREDDIVDGDWRPIGELRIRVQRELDIAPIGRRLDALGDQPVEREGLVIGAREQTLLDIVAYAVGRRALDDQRIETVVRALHGEDGAAPLGRIWIGIGKMREAGGLEGLAMHGDACRGLSPCADRKEQEEGQDRP